MREHFIKFIDEDVDGCGTDVTVIARVYGNDITVGTIDRIKDAICNYKNENEGEWDTDGCILSCFIVSVSLPDFYFPIRFLHAPAISLLCSFLPSFLRNFDHDF